MGVTEKKLFSGCHKIKNERATDLVGTDWVNQTHGPRGRLFVTCRCPNRLIKWAETLHGGVVGPLDSYRVGVSVKKTDKNAVLGLKGANFWT